MRVLKFFATAFTFFGLTCSYEIPYDRVAPFPEVLPTTIENKVALRFLPMLYISQGCSSYPAVNAKGDTNNGLGIMELQLFCNGPSQKSQVYGRLLKYRNYVAIMYAWYFPNYMRFGHRHMWDYAIVWLSKLSRKATILAVTVKSFDGKHYSPPDHKFVDHKHFMLKHTWGVRSNLKATEETGEFQPLIMWNNLTDKAREALENAEFHNFDVPVNNKNFKKHIDDSFSSLGWI